MSVDETLMCSFQVCFILSYVSRTRTFVIDDDLRRGFWFEIMRRKTTRMCFNFSS